MTIRRTIAILLAALLPLACCTACAPKEAEQTVSQPAEPTPRET